MPGITRTPEQRRPFLKILLELVGRDVSTLRELLGVISRGEHHQEE
jgi:hypothetical protein